MGIFQQFPYTNFHEMNLDQIIKIMREMQDEWEATKTEWASYKDFIDNYFANLDVSEEVLEAMRVMAASGELNQIIDPVIIADVTQWLEDNISPTTPAIDASLTIEGAGADAKTTGGLRNAIHDIDLYQRQSITHNFTEAGNWDSYYYMTAGTEYLITLDTILTDHINVYVYGDSANAVTLDNDHVMVKYTPAVSGWMRIYDAADVRSITVKVSTPIIDNFRSILNWIRSDENASHITETINFSAAGNYDTVYYLRANVQYRFTLNTSISGNINVYAYGDSANAITLNDVSPDKWYTPAVSGYLRFYVSSAQGNVSISMKTKLVDLLEYLPADPRNIVQGNDLMITDAASAAEFNADYDQMMPNLIYTIGATGLNLANAPYYNFTGTVLTINYRSVSQSGEVQLAFSSAGNKILYRIRYAGVWTGWRTMAYRPTEYYVGTGHDYTSLTDLLIDIRNDKTDKVVYIESGTYDIYQEYQAAITAGKLTRPTSGQSDNNYFYPYNAFVPNNTKVVGLGNVILKWRPAGTDLTQKESTIWSPVNCLGNVELVNLIIDAKNCRYAIHDDSHSAYPGAVHKYTNVTVNYTNGDIVGGQTRGYSQSTGMGFEDGSTWIFENCIFNAIDVANCIYGHGAGSHNANVMIRDCVFTSTRTAPVNLIRLQTLSAGGGRIKTMIAGCNLGTNNINLNVADAAGIQSFDVAVLNSGNPGTTLNGAGAGNTNPYPIMIY